MDLQELLVKQKQYLYKNFQ